MWGSCLSRKARRHRQRVSFLPCCSSSWTCRRRGTAPKPHRTPRSSAASYRPDRPSPDATSAEEARLTCRFRCPTASAAGVPRSRCNAWQHCARRAPNLQWEMGGRSTTSDTKLVSACVKGISVRAHFEKMFRPAAAQEEAFRLLGQRKCRNLSHTRYPNSKVPFLSNVLGTELFLKAGTTLNFSCYHCLAPHLVDLTDAVRHRWVRLDPWWNPCWRAAYFLGAKRLACGRFLKEEVSISPDNAICHIGLTVPYCTTFSFNLRQMTLRSSNERAMSDVRTRAC